MKTCKHCQNRFEQKSWLGERENTVCFSCRAVTDVLTKLSGGLERVIPKSKKSRDHWKEIITNITQ